MSSLKNTSTMIIFLIAFGLISQAVKIIPEGRTGIVFDALQGGVQEKGLGEGLHFLLPAVQKLIVFDTRIITYAFSNNRTELTLGSPIIAKTNDGQVVGIEMSLVTRMIPEKAPDVYQKLRTDYEPVLKSKTGKIIQEVIARHVADALYTEETRRAVTEETKEYLAKSFAESGFELKDVLLRKIDFSKEYISAIEAKQIALQKAELAQIRKLIAEKDKRIAIIRGEGESRSVAIKGRAVQANPLVSELEFLETIDSTAGKIPVITGIKGATILSLDKLLNGV